MLTIDGLVTGIDTASIVEGLTEFSQRQISLLESERAEIQTEQSAFQGVEAQLLSLRSSAARLSRSRQNVLQSRTAVSGNEDILSAAAGSGAPVGVYTVEVQSLARAHQIASQGFSSEQAEITTGTFSLSVGGIGEVEIAIDDTNNTLRGLADAINSADSGVAATVINDGSSGTPFRLLLSAEETGARNSIQVTNSLAASAGEAIRPDFTGPAIQEAADAALTLGSGTGAIAVTSATNQVDDLIPGVTLDLKADAVGQPVSITVGRDVEAATEAVNGFVDAFNAVMTFIDERSNFDAETETGGVLLGNRNTIAIQDEVRRTVTDLIEGLDTDINRLSSIGISVTDAGQLIVNSARLSDVLEGRVEGVSERDVIRLFAFSGESSNPNIELLSGSTRSVARSEPYEVEITQAATQAAIQSGTALASSITIDSSNDSLVLSVDGRESSQLNLQAGTYTADELAQHLTDLINADPELAGRTVSVGLTNGNLEITSLTYGSQSKLEIVSGTSLTALGFAGDETDTGRDVVGRFLVDGEIETATGRGRLLTGDVDNEHTADMQLLVSLTEAQVADGVDGSLSVTRGFASRLDKVIGRLTDPTTGRITTANDAFEEEVERIEGSITQQTNLFELRRENLVAEFIAMERAVQQLQSQSSFLSAQLGGVSSSALPGL